MMKKDLEKIFQAINERKTITFEYKKPNKENARRIGNPHIVYYRDKGMEKLWLDLYQISGASDSVSEGTTEFPHWVTLEYELISNVELTADIFQPADDYQQHSSRFFAYEVKV